MTKKTEATEAKQVQGHLTDDIYWEEIYQAYAAGVPLKTIGTRFKIPIALLKRHAKDAKWDQLIKAAPVKSLIDRSALIQKYRDDIIEQCDLFANVALLCAQTMVKEIPKNAKEASALAYQTLNVAKLASAIQDMRSRAVGDPDGITSTATETKITPILQVIMPGVAMQPRIAKSYVDAADNAKQIVDVSSSENNNNKQHTI